jgi:integrase
MVLVITPSGTRSFVLYRRVNGKPTRILLGHFPAMTLEQSRDAASLRGAEIVRGIDPNEVKRERRRDMPLGDAFDLFQDKVKSSGRSSTVVSHKSRFDTCLGIWKDRRLSSIKREDVVLLHQTIGKERGKTTANRGIQLLRAIYNHYADVMELEIVNPAARIEMFKEQPRERYLLADELPKFFQALEAEPDEMFRDFFALCLWCGARRGNFQSMKWEHVNLIEKVWTIPAEQFKTNKSMRVILSPEALDILKRRRLAASSGEYVFQSYGKRGHLVEVKGAWERLLERAGLANLHVHDLRHTLASWQAAQGTSLHIIGRSLGHARPEANARYAHIDLDPIRAAVESATKAMVNAGKEGAK